MRNTLQAVLDSVRDLPANELPELIGELEFVKAAAWARLVAGAPARAEHDELLDIAEASARLGMSKDYLYRHHDRLPFTRREGRRLLFSAVGIDRHIRQNRS